MSVTEELLKNFQHRIESLTLVTGTKGVFDVEVDGEMVYSKEKTRRKPGPGEVVDAMNARF